MANGLDIKRMNVAWQNQPRRSSRAKNLAMNSIGKNSRVAEMFLRFVAVEIETHGSMVLHPDCRAWFAAGPKRETIFDSGYRLLFPLQHREWFERNGSTADY